MEPTETLMFNGQKTDQKNQQRSTVSRTEMMTQKTQATEHGTTATEMASKEIPIVVTRVDSSITKVTSTLIPALDDKASAKATELVVHITKDTVKAQIGSKDGSNATTRMKPKEVRMSRSNIYFASLLPFERSEALINYVLISAN